MRAAESARPDRICDDPLAAAFVAAASEEIPPAPPGAAEFMAVRTRFYDDFLLSSGVPQVVVLAAGLDARAFRLPWPPGVRLFELDLPELLVFKEKVVSGAVPVCSRVVVPVDLRSDWPAALLSAGFDRSVPTAWIAEGLLQYLNEAEIRHLLDAVRELSCAGSRFAFDHMDTSANDRESVVDAVERIRSMGAEMELSTDDPARWLTAHGWTATTSRVPALAVEYGRPLPEFMDPAAANATALCTAALD